MTSYIKSQYDNAVNDLHKELNLTNVMQIPRLEKVCLNIGLKSGTSQKEVEGIAKNLSMIAGQKAIITKAKNSISTFKLREGAPLGCKVTLRGNHMFWFLDRLIYVALPRVRDFRGFNANSFDGQGNFGTGIKEYSIFSEVEYDKLENIKGMNIVINTSANSDANAKALLEKLNFPFYN